MTDDQMKVWVRDPLSLNQFAISLPNWSGGFLMNDISWLFCKALLYSSQFASDIFQIFGLVSVYSGPNERNSRRCRVVRHNLHSLNQFIEYRSHHLLTEPHLKSIPIYLLETTLIMDKGSLQCTNALWRCNVPRSVHSTEISSLQSELLSSQIRQILQFQ